MDTYINFPLCHGHRVHHLGNPIISEMMESAFAGESEKVPFLQRLFIFKIKSKSPSRVEKIYYDLALVSISSFIFYHSLMDRGLYPCWCTCICQNVPCSFFLLWLLHMLFAVSGNSSRKRKCPFLWEACTKQSQGLPPLCIRGALKYSSLYHILFYGILCSHLSPPLNWGNWTWHHTGAHKCL